MQVTGYFIINGKKILVLCRATKKYRAFKLRRTGKDGVFFEDESIYLEKFDVKKLEELISNKVIYL